MHFPNVTLRLSGNSWGQATGADGYIAYLSCTLPSVDADSPDHLDLQISFRDISSDPRAAADVCWGHPSGYIEAEWGNQEEPFTDVAQESFLLALPELAAALFAGLERGKPTDADA